MKNINEILSVPGIGVVFVGPNDLSWSLGVAAGLARARRGRADGVRVPAMSEKHSSGDHGDRGRRREQAEAGIPIASLPSGGLEAPMDATLKLARTVIGR